MRKVFLSTMLLTKQEVSKYISDDFELSDANYKFPMTYIIEQNVEDGDDVLVSSIVQANAGENNVSYENFEIYADEVKKALAGKKVNLVIEKIETVAKFESHTFNVFFKTISSIIKDNDEVYMDITFGMKPYSFAMFIAGAYAVKACRNTDIGAVIYAQKYTGGGKAQKDDPAIIYDMTGLFYLNQIAGEARPGEKQGLDTLFNIMIKD